MPDPEPQYGFSFIDATGKQRVVSAAQACQAILDLERLHAIEAARGTNDARMPNPTQELSPAARHIWNRLMAEMQAAEDLGGVATTTDYIRLMDAIIAECQLRRTNANAI